MRWLKSLISRDRRESEFDRELQFHIDEVTREKRGSRLAIRGSAPTGYAGIWRKGAGNAKSCAMSMESLR